MQNLIDVIYRTCLLMRIRGTHLAETFRIFRSSCKMVSTDPTDMPVLAAICFTVKRRSSITICSTRAIMSSDRLVRGRGSFGLFSHDVRPSLNCRTHERTFFTSITPSLHVSLNSWWISMGFMPRKWRNRIITCCSSNVNVAIFGIYNTTVTRRRHKHSTGMTVFPFGLTQPKEQPRFLQQLSRFYLLPFPRKKLADLRTWMHHVLSKCNRIVRNGDGWDMQILWHNTKLYL